MADETAGPERDRPRVGSVGSVAEETARLLDALLAGTSGVGESSGHADASAEAPAPDGEVCHRWPVGQRLRVVRTVLPETLARLADLAAAMTDTLRDVAASRW